MERRPRLLVTNDDGYRSPGIKALAEALEPVGEVWVVAPNQEQSAVSHALTLNRPLHLEQLGERRFAVDGTPTDCVALGLLNLLADQPPALVVSGINAGVNMGADVHYSGTVAAAFEGLILGVPAIAVSQQQGEGVCYERAAQVARRIAEWCIGHGLPRSTLLNVNVPLHQVNGVRLTRLGDRQYTEGVLRTQDPRGRTIYWIGGGEPVWEATPGTDFHELAAGHISVTPLGLDLTETGFLQQLQELQPSWLNHHDARDSGGRGDPDGGGESGNA